MRQLSPFASHRGLLISCLALFCIGFSLEACKASVKADANAQASTEGKSEVDFDAEGDSTWDDDSQPSEAAGDDAAPGSNAGEGTGSPGATSIALLGARHDLLVTPGRAPACKCLAVVVGPPSAPGLSWQGPEPLINRTSQIVVGVSSQGVSCEDGAPQASYMGYEQRDADVIVQVEAAVAGRPVTQGAIIPRPGQGGRILIEGNGNVPFGQATSGPGACVIQP
jgi:hypothetical protein